MQGCRYVAEDYSPVNAKRFTVYPAKFGHEAPIVTNAQEGRNYSGLIMGAYESGDDVTLREKYARELLNMADEMSYDNSQRKYILEFSEGIFRLKDMPTQCQWVKIGG
jgi:hypothetical protein